MVILTGDVVWAELGTGVGREQGGRRPVVIIASNDFLAAVDRMIIMVPVTSRNCGWPNHVAVSGATGLDRPSYAMTEQVRAISRERVVGHAGSIDQQSLDRVRVYLRDFLDLW
jgi:mRNA interferase MazF